MSLISDFDSSQLRSMLRTSNYWARHNRNSYPNKLQTAITELYDWTECTCAPSCTCKRYGCTQHLVRKDIADFTIALNHFLECYVDQNAHDAIRGKREKGRGYKAVEAIDSFEGIWHQISAGCDSKSLLCDEWCSPVYSKMNLLSFSPSSETIYLSKWMSLLSMGTYVAYDNGSISLLNRDYENPKSYRSLIERIRASLIVHLNKNKITINEFCKYDNPHEFFNLIPNGSSRPIGNVIDKLYLTL